jgi:hypothetical protein
LLQGGLLAGAGVATAGAMSAVFTGTAKASTPNPQLGWGWCEYCATMWWTAGQASSACSSPSHDQHAVGSGSYDYEQFNDGGSRYNNTTNPQANWFWCGNCQGMFWGPSTNNVCQSSNDGTLPPHAKGSETNYYLYYDADTGSTSNPQPYWHWCGLCGLLYWQGPSGTQAGYCPGYLLRNYPNYGRHEAGSSTSYCIDWSGKYS